MNTLKNKIKIFASQTAPAGFRPVIVSASAARTEMKKLNQRFAIARFEVQARNWWDDGWAVGQAEIYEVRNGRVWKEVA